MKRLHEMNILGTSVYSIIMICIGSFIMAIGINLFIEPVDGLLPTGITGLSAEISFFLNKYLDITIPYNIIFFFLNIPIIIFGYFKIGNKFIFKTFLAVIFFTIFAEIVPIKAALEIATSGDTLISSLIGAIIIGCGVGLILRVGGSSGGTDIISVYISLYKGKPFGLYSLISNSFVLFLGYFTFNDLKVVAIMLIHLYVLSSVIDLIHNSQEKRTLIIITNKSEEVAQNILSNFRRSLTVIDSKGAYGKTDNKTLIMSISYGELQMVIKKIKEADEKAFINVIKTDMIVGNFENPYQKTL